MRPPIRLAAAAALVAVLGCLHEAPAAPTTPLGDPGFQAFLDALAGFRTSTYTDDASPEAKAIDRAASFFADPSTTYAEDVKDLAKALRALRAVFRGDGSDPLTIEFVMDQHSSSVTPALVGLAGRAYADEPALRLFAVYTRIDRADNPPREQKRLRKLVAVMNAIQAHARKRQINLYVAT